MTEVKPRRPAAPARDGGSLCPHAPACPAADAPDRDAARVVSAHPEQGWSLLCNGVVLFDDTGGILPGGETVGPRRRARTGSRWALGRHAQRRRDGGGRRTRATTREITREARRLVAERGPEGATPRAVARQLGMSSPALRRHVPSRRDLLEHLVADLYDEVRTELEAARDALPPGDGAARLLAAAQAFRRWTVRCPREFGLLHAVPPCGRRSGPARDAMLRLGATLGGLAAELWAQRPFPVPPEDELDPAVLPDLRRWGELLPSPLPPTALHVLLSGWFRLHGLLCLEASGHLPPGGDADGLFRSELASFAGRLGTVRPADLG